MKEKWLPIPGYEGFYEVSDLGRVRSLDRKIPTHGRYGPIVKLIKGIVLKGSINKGYPAVAISIEDVATNFYVHALVMKAFVGERPEGMEIRHLDGIKTNSRLTNLSYGTKKENVADCFKHGSYHRGKQHASSKLSEEKVKEIRSAVWTSESNRYFKEKFGVTRNTIYRARNGQCWAHIKN